MPDTEDLKLAKKIAKYYKDNPQGTISDVSKEFGETEGRVRFVLDEYRVEDGAVNHAGPGAGGGWVTAPENAAV